MSARVITSFRAGGLRHVDAISMLPRFRSGPVDLPPYVDKRYLCIPASDQGATSECAGYATAGKGETIEYQRTTIYRQMNASAVYADAKRLDGHPGEPGTDLISAVRAGKATGVIPRDWIETVTYDLTDLLIALLDGPQIVGMEITNEHNDCDPRTGRIAEYPAPVKIGGHAVLCNFFDADGAEGFGWQGSWGMGWGCQSPIFRGMGRMTLAQARAQFQYAVILRRP